MTAAAVEPSTHDRSALSHRCRIGQHDRCSGGLCPCSCEHPTATNARAAKAVVLHARDTDDARLLLDILGIVDGPTSRDIQPDITGGMYVPKMGTAPGGKADPPPVRHEPDEPPASNVTTPPGLRVLPPAATSRPRPPAAARPARKPGPKLRPVAVAPAPKQATKKTPTTKPATTVKAPRPPRELTPIDHGTLTGHSQHSHRKIPIPPDDPCGCRAARKAYDDARTTAKKAATAKPTPKALPAKRITPVLPPIAHGTVEGRQAHHDRGALPICEACQAAVAARTSPTAEEIRAKVDAMAPRVLEDGSINARHVAIESTLRARHGHPSYIADLDGPGKYRPVDEVAPQTPTEGTAPASPEVDAAGTAPDPSGSGHGYAGPDAQPQVSPSRSHSGEGGRPGASDAPAEPPATADWLAKAQQSPNRAVARAAALAIGLRLRIEIATSAQLADGRLLARLDAALDDVATAQARALRHHRTGDT